MRDFVLATVGVIVLAMFALVPMVIVVLAGEFFLSHFPYGRGARFLLIMFKSLRRNRLRTALTYLATFVLVAIVTMVWAALFFLDNITAEKAKDLKVIVQEKWQAFSQMPYSYARPLSEAAANRAVHPDDIVPQDSMTWQYYFGTVDPAKMTRESLIIGIALEPRKIPTMLDAVFDEFDPDQTPRSAETKRQYRQQAQEAVRLMEANKRAIILGQGCLAAINKQVGERITVYGTTYPGIDLEFDIVAEFPKGRYDQIAVLHRDYLNDALDAFPRTHGGMKHPLADKRLNIVWLQVPDLFAFTRAGEQINRSGLFRDPPVKCETLASGIANELGGFTDLIWGLRWLLSPALLGTMTLILANAISISVRERRPEMAVMKVLGYRPGQILALILGEAMLVGAVSGLLSAAFAYVIINVAVGYIPGSLVLPMPPAALWWGPAIGAFAALAGSFIPAWSGARVRVSEVFARAA
jgi:putative ABC transport system permease protein